MSLLLVCKSRLCSRGLCSAPGVTAERQAAETPAVVREASRGNSPVIDLKMKEEKEEEGRGSQNLIRWPSDEEGTLCGGLESNRTQTLEVRCGKYAMWRVPMFKRCLHTPQLPFIFMRSAGYRGARRLRSAAACEQQDTAAAVGTSLITSVHVWAEGSRLQVESFCPWSRCVLHTPKANPLCEKQNFCVQLIRGTDISCPICNHL